MKSFRSALARQRFKTGCVELQSASELVRSKWALLFMACNLAVATFASDLAQRYEKAYFLETAKGQTEEALKIYREIAAAEPADEDKEVTIKALERLVKIYTTSTMPEGSHQEQLEKALQLQQLNKHTEALVLLEQLMLSGAKEQPMTKREKYSFTYDLMEALFASAHILKDESKMASYHKQLLKNPMVDVRMVVSKMPDGGVIYLPEGTYTWGKIGMSVDDQRSITIRGADREKCIIERTSDRSMIWVGQGGKLTLENLTLKSQLSSLDKEKTFEELGCALLVEDGGTATLTNCAIQASEPIMRCPSGVKALGFAEVHLFNCSLSGYSIPVYYGEGSSGSLTDCTIEHTLRTSKDTIVKVGRSIFHDAKYEAVSCYGGKLSMDRCLIINAKEAFSVQYARRVDQFSLSNSAVINCDKGLPEYPSIYSSDGPYLLTNNVFVLTKDAAADPGEHNQSAQRPELPQELILTNNIFYAKEARVWGNALMGAGIPSQKNTFWSSESWAPAKGRESGSLDHMLIKDPEFKNPDLGNYAPQNHTVKAAGHGLTDSATIQALWEKYEETCK